MPNRMSLPLPPFLCNDPLIGEPPTDWDDFLAPQLRRFPYGTNQDIHIQQFLSYGSISCNATVRFGNKIRGGTTWTIKLFFQSTPPLPVITKKNNINHLEWPPWPLERQVRTTVILEKIRSGLRQSPSSRVFVPALAKTRLDCLRCLYSFSAEGRLNRYFDGLPLHKTTREVTTWSSRTHNCFGWLRIPREELLGLNGYFVSEEEQQQQEQEQEQEQEQPQQRQRQRQSKMAPAESVFQFEGGKDYFGLVYESLPELDLQEDAVQRQLKFFHDVGFRCAGGRPAEVGWQGPGILTDLADYSSPVDRWFPGAFAYSPVPEVLYVSGGGGGGVTGGGGEEGRTREGNGVSDGKVLYKENSLKLEARATFIPGPMLQGEAERAYQRRMGTNFFRHFLTIVKARMGPVIELANLVEASYVDQGRKGVSKPYFDYQGNEDEIEYAKDELAHIRIPEIEPRKLLLAWIADERKQEQYVRELSSAMVADSASTSNTRNATFN